jgi:DNA processing protein
VLRPVVDDRQAAGGRCKESGVDLQTAVAVSMLPFSRARVAAAFKDVREHSLDTSLEPLMGALGVPPDERRAIADSAHAGAAGALKAAPADVEPVAWFDPRYPALLSCTRDPSPVLWVRGDVAALNEACVAIVGSRAATPYAVQVAERLASELAARGIGVTSGLARGVDSASHRGCLDANGRTIAVLGSGVDRIYPPEHEDLAGRIASSGAVVSELAPGAAPLPEHFPLRNRIISGISLAVVVVEASEQSGSLITARYALEQGRDVMAVPGNVLSGRNRGSHALLKDGAKVVETADDILEELGWPGAVRPPSGTCKLLNEDPLLARMQPGEVYQLDELAAATGMMAARLLTRLTELELAGRVSAAGGGRFMRI